MTGHILILLGGTPFSIDMARREAIFKTKNNLEDVQNNQIIQQCFNITKNDDATGRFQTMLYPKFSEDVKLQVYNTGTIKVTFSNYEEFWGTRNCYNSAFINNESHIKAPYKMFKFGKEKIEYLGEEEIIAIEIMIKSQNNIDELEHTILIPSDNGFGYVSKKVTSQEYFEYIQLREEIKNNLIIERDKSLS